MNPKVSIIIATYNSGKTLNRALDSVQNQKFQDWECIVVDGASKDDTIAIVKEYEQRDSRFRHISEPDHGIYDAFNKGWRMAKGEWIHYLGSDDCLTEIGFSELMAEPHDDVDVITGDVWIMKHADKKTLQISIGIRQGCHQGKLVRKSIIEKIGGFDEKYQILADKNMMIQLDNLNVKCVNIRSVVAYFYLGGESQGIEGAFNRLKENISIYKADPKEKHPYFRSIKIFIKSLFFSTYIVFINRLKGIG